MKFQAGDDVVVSRPDRGMFAFNGAVGFVCNIQKDSKHPYCVKFNDASFNSGGWDHAWFHARELSRKE